MEASLKEQKEAFVSGLDGTTPQELILVCSTAPIGYCFYKNVSCFLTTKTSKLVAFLVEAVSFWIPMIVCQSNLLYPYGVGLLVFQVLVVVLLSLMGKSGAVKDDKSSVKVTESGTDSLSSSSSITIYRSAMLYLTFVAILAVDFHVFPRRFVKTEETGYSLMDIGAASFVIAKGLVSRRAKRRSATDGMSGSKLKSLSSLGKRIFPLVFMGSLRLLTHKELEYQEHVSEYGVHWNFFYTLAFLSLMEYFISTFSSGPPSVYLPVVLQAGYQLALTVFGVQEWVLLAPRSCRDFSGFERSRICDLFVANREGLLGCVGYTALYLFSEWIGYQYLWRSNESTGTSELSPYHRLLIPAVMCFGTWQILEHFMGVIVSRRTTNATFAMWVLLLNLLQLSAIQFVEQSWHSIQKSEFTDPFVLSAVNRQGLVIFIVANLMTGIVNLTINTLEASDTMAFAILVLYVSTIGIVAVLLDGVRSKRPPRDSKKKSS